MYLNCILGPEWFGSLSSKLQKTHPKTLSSNDTFVQNRFHPMTLSSKTILIPNTWTQNTKTPETLNPETLKPKT